MVGLETGSLVRLIVSAGAARVRIAGRRKKDGRRWVKETPKSTSIPPVFQIGKTNPLGNGTDSSVSSAGDAGEIQRLSWQELF